MFATLSASDDDISCQLELIYYPAELSRNNAQDPVATGQTNMMAVKVILEGDSYGPEDAPRRRALCKDPGTFGRGAATIRIC